MLSVAIMATSQQDDSLVRLEMTLWRRTTVPPQRLAEQIRAGQPPSNLRPIEKRLVRERLRQSAFFGLGKSDVHLEFRQDRLGRDVAAMVRFMPSATRLAWHRQMVAQVANELDLATYDATNDKLYEPNQVPFGDLSIVPQTPMIRLDFDLDLVSAMAERLGSLSIWGRTPPYDESGAEIEGAATQTDLSLWATPQNQQVLLSGRDTYGWYTFSEGWIVPPDADVATLREMDNRQWIIRPNGAQEGVGIQGLPEWPQWLQRVGWIYEVDGPDDLWGHLHASSDRRDVVETMTQWCREVGRTWIEIHEVNGEAVGVRLPYVPAADKEHVED